MKSQLTFVLILAIAGIAIPGRSVQAAEKTHSLSPKIDADAREMLTHVTSTSYTHESKIDASQGVFKTDSSGLLDYVLDKVSKPLVSQIKLKGKEARPTVEDYFAAIQAAPTTRPAAHKSEEESAAWERVGKLADAKPGDVLVWKSTGAKGEVGHIAIIDEPPKLEPKETETKTERVRGPKGRMEEKQVKVPGPDPHRIYQVVVIDSAASGHASDTRAAGTGGVGRGTLWVDVNSEGQPIEFHWSAQREKPKPAAMIIGRAIAADAHHDSPSSSGKSAGK